MRHDLALVMSHLGLGDRALDIIPLVTNRWVIRWQDAGGGAHDGTDLVVHLLALLIVEDGLQRRALSGVGGGGACWDGDGGVCVEVVVVVCRGSNDGAGLTGLREVDLGVRRGKGRVRGADYRADLLGGHVDVVG